MNKLQIYYKLCGVKLPKDAPKPLISYVGEKNISIIFTKKQVNLYIKKDKSGITIKENIVGGGKKALTNSTKILVVV